MVRKSLCWARDSTALPSWTERIHVMASSTVLPCKTRESGKGGTRTTAATPAGDFDALATFNPA